MLVEDEEKLGKAWMCPQCRGLLCTEEHLGQILGTKHVNAVLLPTWRASMEGIRSPWTGEPMKSFRTKTEVSVIVDRCEATNGVWLDEEEFNHLQAAIGDIVKAGLDLESQAKRHVVEEGLAGESDPYAMPHSWEVKLDREALAKKSFAHNLNATLMPVERWIQPKRKPYCTQTFMGIIAGFTVFTFASTSDWGFAAMNATAGLSPSQFFEPGHVFRIMTAPFLPGGFIPAFFSLYLLWMYGDNIEDAFGRFFFAMFYLAACGVGGLALAIAEPVPGLYVAGSLISCCAIMGAYVVLYPAARMRVGLLITVVDTPAMFFAGFWLVLLMILSNFPIPWISPRANLAALFFGAIVGGIFRLTALPNRRDA